LNFYNSMIIREKVPGVHSNIINKIIIRIRGKATMDECIICRQKTSDFSDEHVIPDAINGYYHIYSVCKICNSKLGSLVDSKLINHKFMEFQRLALDIRGKKGDIPNPFSGIHVLKNNSDTKAKLEIDSDGNLKPYMLPNIPNSKCFDINNDFTISLDKRDEGQLENIVSKICARNGIPREKIGIKREETPEVNNSVQMILSIDTRDFKIGLLKIAYEFAVDTIPAYFNDPKAKVISDILYNNLYERLENEDLFIGSGIDSNIIKPFEVFIDAENENHHLILMSDKKLGFVCFIKLFNVMFLGVRLSKKRYKVPGDIIIGINDMGSRRFIKMTPDKLMKENFTTAELRFQYYFDSRKEADDFFLAQQDSNFSVYKENGVIPVFDRHGSIKIGDIEQIMFQGSVHVTGPTDFKNDIVTQVHLDEELYIKVLPSGQLVRIVKVNVEQHRIKNNI
jgi:hypothetical protein